jgi:hypothetical protein
MRGARSEGVGALRVRGVPSAQGQVLALALLTVAPFGASCSRESDTPGPRGQALQSPGETSSPIYERAGKPFAAVQLLRPDTTAELPFDVYLAPMIVQETSAEHPSSTAAFGELALGPEGRASCLAERPVVYYARSQASIGGEAREQLAFVWWYPEAQPGALSAQGVRMTLGKSGVPILWEMLNDPSGARLVFVSESLEELARAQHGAPLAGRRFSVERSLAEAPSVVVARAISNGGTPLGPFVYLEAATRAARTLLCRCSPSEFDALAGEALFELRSLDSLAELGLAKQAWTAELPVLAGAPLPAPDASADPRWLELNLRLPLGL